MIEELEVRLKKRTLVMENGCHEWQGYVMRNGYGQIGHHNKVIYTHRAAWMVANSDPGEAYVLHKCDNRRCVNPDHLFLGTFQDNMDDMVRKDRQSRGERNGHAKLTAEQALHIRTSGARTSDLARRYNVSKATVSQIKSGKNWAHI